MARTSGRGFVRREFECLQKWSRSREVSQTAGGSREVEDRHLAQTYVMKLERQHFLLAATAPTSVENANFDSSTARDNLENRKKGEFAMRELHSARDF